MSHCFSEKEQAHHSLLRALLINNQKRYDAELDSLVQVACNQVIDGDDKYYEAWTYWLLSNKSTNEARASLGDDCQPARSLWFEMTSNNKVKLFWWAPQNIDELSGYYVYRTKESEMNWQKIKTVSASATSVADNSNLQDETTYLYKVVAYYQTTDCCAAPAQSRYNEFEYFVRVHWSVDGLAETGEKGIEIYPNPANDFIRIDGIEPTKVQVYNALGQKMKTVQNTNEINVSDLAEGIYLFRITDAERKHYSNRVAVRR